jgi:hypothetical protein
MNVFSGTSTSTGRFEFNITLDADEAEALAFFLPSGTKNTHIEALREQIVHKAAKR